MKTEIKNLKQANIEGQIYAANTLFADSGFKVFDSTYTGIYKLSEFQEIEGKPLSDEDYHPKIRDATFLDETVYYTWYEGYVVPLIPAVIEDILHKLFYVRNIKKALENTYEAEDYLKELVNIALTEF